MSILRRITRSLATETVGKRPDFSHSLADRKADSNSGICNTRRLLVGRRLILDAAIADFSAALKSNNSVTFQTTTREEIHAILGCEVEEHTDDGVVQYFDK